MPTSSTVDLWLDRGAQLLESVTARTVLSALILVSVMPPGVLGLETDISPYFLLVFGPELLLRLALLERRRRRRRLRLGEVVVLLLDLVAIASFLPWATGQLRFLRLARLLLLLGYWRDLVRELWTLLSRRERRYQVLLVLILGAILALASAVVLIELGAAHDFDGDGDRDDADRAFRQILWWSFRQIQDPGNLVPVADDPLLVAASVVLTFAGLLLFSFFIGIGTTVVEELVERSRSRPLGLRLHTIVLGLTPHTPILLRELAEIYRKNLRPYRGAWLADAATPDELHDPPLRHFRYLRGDPAHPPDLDRVGVGRAKRVLVLGDDSRDPDASVISAILAVRERNPRVPLYPDLEHERNFPAARAAGGAETHLVGSGSMLGHYVAQNVAYPGIHHLYRHLLQSAGCEIYTYLFSDAERRRLCQPRHAGGVDVEAFHRLAHSRHRATLLGLFTAEQASATVDDDDLDLVLNPVTAARESAARRGDGGYAFDERGRLRCTHLRGLVGVALRFRDMTQLAQDLLAQRLPEPSGDEVEDTGGTGIADLRLRPLRRDPERVLILGAGPRVPRVVSELTSFFRRLDITVLSDGGDRLRDVAHDVQLMLAGAFGSPRLDESPEEGVFRLALEQGDVDARVTLMAADWTHGHRLEAEGAVTLEAADVVLLLPSRDRTDDSDGRIALDCLHLANLERTGAVRFRPRAHVLALVRDPAKGHLLESRLTAMVGGQGCRYTVISRELARHHFLVQSVFVRGLSPIYLRLLASRGQHLARLRATGDTPAGDLDPRALSDHLLDRHGLVLVGFERRAGDGEPEVVIDPRDLRPGRRVPWSEVAALYVLGDGRAITSAAG